MHCQTLIDSLQQDNEALLARIKERFGSMGDAQWMWRPAPNRWNALEVLEHLNLVLAKAYVSIEKQMEQAEDDGWHPTEHYSVGWVGEFAVQLMDNSDARRYSVKLKTTKELQPRITEGSVQQVYSTFMGHLLHFHQILERSRQLPLGKVRVRILPGSFVRFRLGDTLRFLGAHTLRHIHQAERLLHHQDFPQTEAETQSSSESAE